ncbi:MAG TPA: 23S rRNA (guanosine(2251)-2'-O)-methyltransferase RlmB [Thermomicrobiales bacterium]|nr:23S rRNA (guanosine(2251)-2'-O)-methyltransferase RlmB [Thermomicrobiales bacterium]
MPPVRGEVLYGRNAVAEALRGRRQAHQLFMAEGIRQDARLAAIRQAAELAGANVTEVPRASLDRMTHGANHQGVTLDASSYRYVELTPPPDGVIVALDHLQDPQNLGTLLRAAEACAVPLVLIPADRAAEISPAVVNASAGAVEHLRVSKVINLARSLDELKQAGWWVAGLDEGDASEDIYDTKVPDPTVLLIGSEGQGISLNVRRRCDILVRLPMYGRVASLNAATAGSVALFELTSRRMAK